MEALRFAKLFTDGLQNYFQQLFPLLRDTVDATIETLFLYVQLIILILHPVYRLIITVQAHIHPHLRPLVQSAVASFLVQPPRDILLETTAVILLCFISWLEWKKSYVRRLRSWIGAKSRIAGIIFPHLLYWSIVSCGFVLWSRGLRSLARIFGLPTVGVLIPLVQTVLLVYEVEVGRDSHVVEEPRTPDRATSTPTGSKSRAFHGKKSLTTRVEEMLRYWVVFGLVWGARSMWRFWAPKAMQLLLINVDIVLFYVFIWLQLPFTDGARVVYEGAVLNVSRSYLRSQKRSQKTDQLNIAMRLLVACNILTEEKARVAEDTVTESGLVLLGVIFFVTPRFATFIGTVLIGCYFPAYLSASSLVYESTYTQNNWLSYWAIFSLFDAVHSALSDVFAWVPLWYHAKLAVILWLQLPYYRGAALLLEQGVNAAAATASNISHTQFTPKKRKRE